MSAYDDLPDEVETEINERLMEAGGVLENFGFEPVTLEFDGSEPFASLDLGDGLWLDLTAKVRGA